jgi:putrescine transport system ATP-binding protein
VTAATAQQPTAIAGAPAGAGHLRIRGLRKRFDGVAAVDGVDLTIARGECFVLLGASGCGKSTLLRLVAGFETPDAGDIEIDGQPMAGLPPYRRLANMMFQSYALFPHMTVRQNVAFGLEQERLPRAEVARRTEEMLELVQLGALAGRRPQQLSGGQQQRVALARSLARRPKLLLLDEPMAALDRRLRAQMQLELVHLVERLGVTCLLVTHDQEEAMTMAHRIAIMDGGRILQVGTPDEIYERPNCRFTARFIGSVNLIEASVGGRDGDHLLLAIPGLAAPVRVATAVDVAAGRPVALALRPEQLRLQAPASGEGVAGTVEDIAYLGSHSQYHVRLAAGDKLLVQVPNDRRPTAAALHQPVRVAWDPGAGVVLLS